MLFIDITADLRGTGFTRFLISITAGRCLIGVDLHSERAGGSSDLLLLWRPVIWLYRYSGALRLLPIVIHVYSQYLYTL